MKYIKNSYCGEIVDGDYTLIIVHDAGSYLKLRTNIWNNIQYYIENDLEVDARLKDIFDVLLECGIIFESSEVSFSYNSIVLQLTSGCNLKCAHCCATTLSTAGKVDLETLDRVLTLNPKALALSGGEPMTHPDFWEIVKHICERYHGSLSLMTNGTLIKESDIEDLCKYFDYFDISLDGKNAEDVARIRGVGVYEKVIEVVKQLKARNKEIGLSMVSEKSSEELREFYDLTNSLAVVPVIRELNVVDRVKENLDQVVLGGKSAYIDTVTQIFRKTLSKDTNLRRCGMIRRSLFVDVRGNLYPCGSLAEDRFCIGNIKDMSDLPDYNSVVQSLLEDNRFARCRECKYQAGCWECLGVLVGYAQIEEVFAEYCKCTQQKWENILRGEM